MGLEDSKGPARPRVAWLFECTAWLFFNNFLDHLFIWVSNPFLMHLGLQLGPPNPPNPTKNLWKIDVNMWSDFWWMLVSIVDGFLVDLVVILSTAKPSELSSRLGAVPLRAILAYQFFDWFVDGFLVDVGPMLGPKIHLKSIKNPPKSNCWFLLDLYGFGGPRPIQNVCLNFLGELFLRVLEPRWAKIAPRAP